LVGPADCEPELPLVADVVEDVCPLDLSVPVLPLDVWPVGAESSGAGSEELLLVACCRWLPKEEPLGPAAREFVGSVALAIDVGSIVNEAAEVIDALLSGAVLIGTVVTRIAGVDRCV
jgi:hypothetical protein